jgi:hypothetical protein
MYAVLSQSKGFHGQVLSFSVFGIIYLVLLHFVIPPSYYFGYHSFLVSFFATYVDAGRNGLYGSNHTREQRTTSISEPRTELKSTGPSPLRTAQQQHQLQPQPRPHTLP